VKVIDNKESLQKWRASSADEVGFVPTMGNLHRGHLSLVERSMSDNDTTVVSIFINPTQFGPGEDYGSYPRTLERDLQILDELAANFKDKHLVVFAPRTNEEIYENDFQTKVVVNSHLTKILCAKTRPSHFEGVTTVVSLLFNLVSPKRAYFGKKDYQQLKTIERMVSDLELPIEIVGMEIIREEDGLALSSRNQYLSEGQRAQALELRNTLVELKRNYSSDFDFESFKFRYCGQPGWEYLEIYSASELLPVTASDSKIVALGALKVGKTRLIDNIEI
jgi:pantoate--beta-alanine ligase